MDWLNVIAVVAASIIGALLALALGLDWWAASLLGVAVLLLAGFVAWVMPRRSSH
jgi:uncharacterized membrane protein YeiH